MHSYVSRGKCFICRDDLQVFDFSIVEMQVYLSRDVCAERHVVFLCISGTRLRAQSQYGISGEANRNYDGEGGDAILTRRHIGHDGCTRANDHQSSRLGGGVI